MTNLFNPPPTFDLPLSKGSDLYVDFIYKPLIVDDNGEPVLSNGQYQFAEADYPDGAAVTLTIDASPPVVVDAAISGSHAVVLEDHEVTDDTSARLLWRIVLTYVDGRDEVLANGKTVRKDGST